MCDRVANVISHGYARDTSPKMPLLGVLVTGSVFHHAINPVRLR